MKRLVIDDERTFDFDAEYARYFDDALTKLTDTSWDEVWLDHDLGDVEDRSGTDLVNTIEEAYHILGNKPDVKRFVIHSSNPVGGARMAIALTNLGYDIKVVNAKYYMKKGK